MKNRFLVTAILLCALLYVAESCQKNAATPASSQTLSTAIASMQAIGVGSTTASLSAADSIYVIHVCMHDEEKDSIAFSSLPSSIFDYLIANFAGYTAQGSFVIKDTAGATAGYIVIIQYNDTPVGLKFNATGTFIKVLEQRLGRHLRDDDSDGGDSTFTHHHDYDGDSTHHYDNDSTHHDGDSTHGH